MARLNKLQSTAFALITLGMMSNVATAAPINVPVPTVPQPQYGNQYQTRTVITSGTSIPVVYDGDAEKILVIRDETVPLTLTVSSTVKSRYGTILIPAGTKIVGQLRPSGQGSQFVATGIALPLDGQKSINASSRVVTRTERIRKGASTGSVIKGAAIGGAAATAISAILGDRAIATEEVLGGTGLGALAGLFLGRKSVDVISINPNTDLTSLTLRSNLPVTVALR